MAALPYTDAIFASKRVIATVAHSQFQARGQRTVDEGGERSWSEELDTSGGALVSIEGEQGTRDGDSQNELWRDQDPKAKRCLVRG